MKKSNKYLSKVLKRLSRLDFSKYRRGYFNQIGVLNRIPFEIFDLEPTSSNYVYRAVINKPNTHYETIRRIAFNPNPKSISRANLKGQAVAYYACDYDIALIEACHDTLSTTSKRIFELTVSKWKIQKKIAVQIINSSSLAQNAGTDLNLYYAKCRLKQLTTLPKKKYRTWYLKTKFMAEQFAKEISSEKDYYITARYSNQLLKKTKAKGIIYPSIRYLYKGFNYAFSPCLFKDNSLQLEEISEYKVFFDKNDITKYPTIIRQNSTSYFDDDNILWR